MFRTSKFITSTLSSRPGVISVMETKPVTDYDIERMRNRINMIQNNRRRY
jgi:hypothetical protein